jgi:hypothetical protein
VALYNTEKRLKTPKLTTLTMFEKNLTTSLQKKILSLLWGFQDISLGGKIFFRKRFFVLAL